MATLADVARHAGVAASTVSYVLSGKRSVSDETKDRVNRAIKELKYHPNAGARALASSRSNVLALIVPLRSDMYVPVMMEIVKKVSAKKPVELGKGDFQLAADDLAFGGQVITTPPADEKVILEHPPQSLQRAAYGRLAQKQAGRRARDRPFLRQGGEDNQ